MEIRLLRAFLFSCLLFAFGPPPLRAQAVDLRHDAAFFRQKIPEFNKWLTLNGLDRVFRADSVSITPDKAILYLRPVYTGNYVCDSLQCAWNELESANRRINGQYFHERLLNKWAFLAEVQQDQAEVIVRCHEPAHFLARVYSRDGRIPVEGRSVRSAVAFQVDLPVSLEGVNAGDNLTLIRGKNAVQVCNKARNFLINYYKPKGTPVLWKARIDTSYTTHDEFIIEVTHLSYEICPDGYFEYHRIYVRCLQKGEDVEISWEFQGKYGSGIIFPPRKNDYKDMDLRYKNNLDDYQKRLFKQLTDYLRQ
ncbi:MAG: hypothetical protein U0U46_16755 [Saprospiraceae bacterium]|nr:hypothetical protein [Saprospiraceae bacterium]